MQGSGFIALAIIAVIGIIGPALQRLVFGEGAAGKRARGASGAGLASSSYSSAGGEQGKPMKSAPAKH